MSNTFDNSLFEDSSTIHFGGDGETAFDLYSGFDDAGADTGAAETADTTAEAAADEGASAGESAGSTESGNTEAPTTEQTEAQGQEAPSKLTFKVKIDHQDRDVSIDESELPGIYQRAQNMDRANQRAQAARQEADRNKNYIDRIAEAARALDFQGDTPEAAIEAMLNGVIGSARDSKVEAMVSKGTAKEVAEFIVGQQLKMPEQPQTPAPATDPSAAGGAPSPEQFAADLQALMSRRPEVQSMETFPEEVLSAYAQGEDLTVAYLDYESRKTAAEMKALADQNKIFRQNQESASKAPVRGVTGSGETGAKDDPWLTGFDDQYW